LGLSNRKKLVDLKPSLSSLLVNHQCQLLSINRSSLYYTLRTKVRQNSIKNHIVKVFEQIPIYDEAKAQQQLLEGGFKVSLNTGSLSLRARIKSNVSGQAN